MNLKILAKEKKLELIDRAQRLTNSSRLKAILSREKEQINLAVKSHTLHNEKREKQAELTEGERQDPLSKTCIFLGNETFSFLAIDTK